MAITNTFTTIYDRTQATPPWHGTDRLLLDYVVEKFHIITIKRNGQPYTDFSIYGSVIHLGDIPQEGDVFEVTRETDLSFMTSFFPGSSIRAIDLNTNFEIIKEKLTELENG